MNFYSFDEIKAASDCRMIATALGLTLNADNRCAATWRDGTNPTSVHVTEDGYYDHGCGQGGSVIDLVAAVQGTDAMRAQEWLGEHLNLEPQMKTRQTPHGRRYDELIGNGYTEAARYQYHDAAGVAVIEVVRLEHPERPKEFVQYDPVNRRWTVKGIKAPLYRYNLLPEWAIVVEGEKDADRLLSMNLPATTCIGGARSWHDRYSAALEGKQVWVMHDNDEAGRGHAAQVAASLASHDITVRIVCPSAEPKGDVSDWLDAGGTAEQLSAMLSAAPIADTGLIKAEAQLAAARQANRHDYANYTRENYTDEDGAEKVRLVPRDVKRMIADVQTRFLGFPCRCGSRLFDHDRDTQDIVTLTDEIDMESWMRQKSKQHTDFARVDPRFVSLKVLYRSLLSSVRQYDTISHVPDFPIRSNVYYAHARIPEPDESCAAFNGLLAFFNPATGPDEKMLRTFAAAPLFSQPGVARPLWVIDSEHGQGTGKTTLAEVVGSLYGPVFNAGRRELRYEICKVLKRLVTPSGRRSRVFLVDNVTGKFQSGEFASLVTASTINAIAPYGREEETRPNDLTYVITANSATFDTDISDRAFFIHVARGTLDAHWKRALLEYIERYRWQIIADVLGILKRHTPFDCLPGTRFPEFESEVLQPMCGDIDSYQQVLERVAESRQDANADIDLAKEIEDELRNQIVALEFSPDTEAIFLHAAVVKMWLRDVVEGHPLQTVRNLAKAGMLSTINPKITRYPHNARTRPTGIMWCPDAVEPETAVGIGMIDRRPSRILL